MKTYFTEKQNFVQPWLHIPVAIAFIWLVVEYTKLDEITNNFLISATFVSLISGIVFLLRLETVVDSEGIGYRWFPFQPTFSRIPWRRIECVEVKKYSPMGEFGGWGLRFGRKRTAYNTKGSYGFEVYFTDKKRSFLIGTQRPEELSAIFEKERLVDVV